MIENKVRCVHWQATYKNKNSNIRIKQNHRKVIEHFNFKENIIGILNLNPTNFSYYENWQFNMVSKSGLTAGHIFYIFELSLHNLHICFSSYSICNCLIFSQFARFAALSLCFSSPTWSVYLSMISLLPQFIVLCLCISPLICSICSFLSM